MCLPASVRGEGRAGGERGGLGGASPASLDKDKDRTKIKINQASIYRFIDSLVRGGGLLPLRDVAQAAQDLLLACQLRSPLCLRPRPRRRSARTDRPAHFPRHPGGCVSSLWEDRHPSAVREAGECSQAGPCLLRAQNRAQHEVDVHDQEPRLRGGAQGGVSATLGARTLIPPPTESSVMRLCHEALS
jgi:hypothetical protein